MGINLLGIGEAAAGAALENPAMIGMGVASVLGSGANGNTQTGDAATGILQAADQAAELDSVANDVEQMRHNSQMQWQATWFNEMMDNRSEQMREVNDLRDLAMEQRKADNDVTKEFIKSVRE